jgi:hypothetical protein
VRFNWLGGVGRDRSVGRPILRTVRRLSRVWCHWLRFNGMRFNSLGRAGGDRAVGRSVRWTVRWLGGVWCYWRRFNWFGFRWLGRVGWRRPVGASIRVKVRRLSRVCRRRCGIVLDRLGRLGCRWPICGSVRRMRCIRHHGLGRVRCWGRAIALRRLPILGLAILRPTARVRFRRFWSICNGLRRGGRRNFHDSCGLHCSRLYLLHLHDG